MTRPASVKSMSAPDRMISEAEIEKALDFLRDNAAAIGDAKARVVRAGHMLKHIEALEFKMSSATNIEGRKADARTSERYIAAIEEDAIATGEFEKLKALREAAALKIQAWQSESANYRYMRI